MEEVANKGDLAAIDEWMAPDFVMKCRPAAGV